MELNLEFSRIQESEYFSRDYERKLSEIHEKLHSGDHRAGTTWVDWPLCYDKKELSNILKLAKQIQENSDVLLVVGIGGSYLGAKAGLELLEKKGEPQIVFVGTSLDYSDLGQKLEEFRDKEVSVNVVSKSGTTIEILASLNIIERFMKNKYKNDYKKRMIFTTDREKGYLREKAVQEGIETLVVPEFMGGRYSVLSAVGLLPFAVAKINIKKILEGATQAYYDLNTLDNNQAYKYATFRHIIYTKMGKKIELFSSFTNKMQYFGKWLQQLFCESEGKDGQGLFVSPLTFSTDLHSVGQFIQQGTPIVAETFINVETPQKDNFVLNVPLNSPIKFLENKSISEICKAAFDGTVKAHHDAKVPIAIISIDEISDFNFGYLVYFFEIACATSAYLLDVNPFDQPGVEQYKSYMKQNLKDE